MESYTKSPKSHWGQCVAWLESIQRGPERPLYESGKAMEIPYAKALDICCGKQQAWNGISPRKRLFVLQVEELERWNYRSSLAPRSFILSWAPGSRYGAVRVGIYLVEFQHYFVLNSPYYGSILSLVINCFESQMRFGLSTFKQC